MGIYIKDMEMPTRCFACPFCDVDETEVCCVISHGSYNEYKEIDEKIAIQSRPQDCPLIELPPHGDLIDRDRLKSQVEDTTINAPYFRWLIDNIPIVVPADDVKPVVRGGWEEHGEPNERGEYELWYYSCTRCGAVGVPEFNFCPNCGADMRGEKDG